MRVNEVIVKSALSKSNLPGLTYALNPYRGCSHACTYCYAPYVLREKRPWGEFVDVKLNLPSVLAKETASKPKGVVGIGTVTDAYQPIEKEYEITRKCLEVLLRRNWPISIQTKSNLVLRDLDLIERFKERDVGFTITTLDDGLRKKFEPHSSSIQDRLEALRTITNKGIKTWVFIGPLIPELLGDTLEELIKTISEIGVDHVLYDRLNVRRDMRGFVEYSDFDYGPLEAKIKELCRHYNIRCYNAF